MLRSCLTATAAALILVAAVGPSAMAASPAPTGKTKTLNNPRPTTAKMLVSPIAGTTDTTAFGSQWAVYDRYNVVGRSADSTGDLLAVTAAGRTHRFGVRTPDMRNFSLIGATLTAGSGSNAARVYWWRPADGPAEGGYHAATMSAGAHYLGSTQSGWAEIRPDGTVYDVDAATGEASARAIGNPFASAADVDGITGPTGVIVWNDTQIAFVPFSGGPTTALDVSKLTSLPGGSNTPVCWSASSAAVACGSYYFTGEDDSRVRNVFLDPLDGGPAYAVDTQCPRAAAVLDTRAAWLTCKGKLRVLGAASPVTSADKIGAEPVAGMGGFLTTGPSRHTGLRYSAGLAHTKTILQSTRATSEATEFAVADGSVLWLENGSSGTAVRHRAVSRNHSHTGVKAGTAHRIATSHALHGAIAAAGKAVAYPTRLTSSTVGHHGSETLRVVTPSRSATIHGVDRYLPVSIGDHRVAYHVDEFHARLYNLHSHHTTKYDATGIALSGRWLAYATRAGTIRLKNLDTHSVRTVARDVHLNTGQLYVHGQVVAWNVYTNEGDKLAYFRDMKTGAPASQLPTNLSVWQASDAGLVLEHMTSTDVQSTPNFPQGRAVRFHANMTFLLQPYDGGSLRTLLVADYPTLGPQVAGNVVTWIDSAGRLRARALG
jgi:hypothetical protein